MVVSNMSILSNTTNRMEVNITEEQLKRWTETEEAIHEIAPQLTEVEREFILFGVTPEEWAQYNEPRNILELSIH